ncbi:ciliogenesis and planar polarity effector 1 isoform X2 [Brachyhypopomus gauderio]|uniref:ciliogenesis and planar polarity effector 1 isoform X2 n=1 Tax=Brachyhypopomus gauderio TaxID=698409 RepID=UPI0040434326
MEIRFEVLLSSSIKRRKPWPQFCWLGQEKEGVFLLDDNRISEINLVSGQSKRKTPKLQTLLPRVVTMSGSQNGMWLAGVLVSGELFLWNRDKDSLKMVMSVSAVYELVSLCKAASLRISLVVSGDGQRVLLVTVTGHVFLWECLGPKELSSLRDATVRGRWSQIASSENERLPSAEDKDASLHSVFVQSQAVGDVCLSAFVFTSGEHLIVTFLKVQWEEPRESKISSEGYSVQCVTKSYPLGDLMPPCLPVKSRGALVPAFSPDGQLLAVILNQKDPRATQALFISVQNFVTVTSVLGGCGSKKLSIPPRSYWVGSASWTPGGLYLACVLKRGSLLMLARLGGLVSLSTTGCDIEFGPAHFLPLHPLVTYRPPVAPDDGRSGSSASLRDTLRQRYSVTWHPRLPCLIVSDGYMATVLKVPDRPSAVALLSNLLLDTAQGLERARALLGSEKPHVRPRLESMSTLKFTASLVALKEREIPVSALPLFLRDHGGTGGLRTTFEKVDDGQSDSDEGRHVSSMVEERGRLEFASMFDTLHAQSRSEPDGPGQGVSAPLRELAIARRNLLTAWALGVSLGGVMDQRERLLRYAVSCAVRLARLLRVAEPEGAAGTSAVFDLLGTLLSFLPWDSPQRGGRSCVGVVVDLARRFVRLFADGVRSSRSFVAALLILREVSKSLDQTYSLTQNAVRQAQDDRPPCLSDTFLVPLLQEAKDVEAVTAKQFLLNKPSKRLVAIWRSLYGQTLQYRAELYSSGTPLSQSKELEDMANIISQIQEVLQRSGDHLEQSRALHNITGERHFILGQYRECVQAWQAQLLAESERAGTRASFLETRCCLALLFTQLFCYRLKDAQAMCDSLALQLQSQSGMVPEDKPEAHGLSVGEGPRSDGWLLRPVNREAACAVVQSLGRFMASYFTNHPLAILPPHNVDVLPPVHLPLTPERRVVVLSQRRAAGAVRAQNLSGVWTVDYALELLLLGGLLPEAVWLARSLGDWKTAASLGLAYDMACRQHFDFSRLRWRELHLPAELRPGCIFQAQLEALTGGTAGSDDPDAMEAEDVEVLLASVQEILKASAMAGVDVVSQPLGKLLDSAKDRASSLPALVPPAFYLPAPPLYCPQPAPNTQDSVGGGLLATEREVRCGVAAAIRRLLLLLRAARCSRPAARRYVRGLRRCRQLFRKVRRADAESKDDVLPEGLKKFANGPGYFCPGPGGAGEMDGVAKQTVVCFRELCGLCWMLHVRDQLTVSCRKYQNARNMSKDFQATDAGGAELEGAGLREEALRWACRLLPFSRFLSAEEVLQDLTLSLAAELPPCLTVAETLAAVFPDEEESVRVPLREKYSSLLQRLGRCSEQPPASATPRGMEREEEEGETMMVLIQDQRRKRVREERRLARSLAPVERHLWEREEEEERGGAAAVLNRFSLGSSLSTSTLTDGQRPLAVNEGDTADTLSEPRSPDPQSTDERNVAGRLKSTNEGARKKSVTEQVEVKGPCLPVVGTWRFELEDEEYPRFLELFLSYVLEKDSLDGEEAELPLLSGFSSQLRHGELHSDAFDVLSALNRRRAGPRRGTRLYVFRAGRCFRALPAPPEPSPSVGSGLSPAPSGAGAIPAKRSGLFGPRQPAGASPGDASHSLVRDSLQWSSEMERWPFKTVPQSDVELQLELDSGLEARFPQLARLLEWMIRWADRSVLLAQPGRTKKPEGTGEPVVIRAKASAPAVLFALRLMEQRYTAALLGIGRHYDQIQVPQMEVTVAPVVQPELDWKRERDSSVDTGYPASAGTPITLPDLDLQRGPGSPTCEEEEIHGEENSDPGLSGPVDVTSDPDGEASFSGHKDMTSNPDVERGEAARENEVLPTVESDGDSSMVDTLEKPSFGQNISVQIRTQNRTLSGPRDKTLTLADLESPQRDDDSSKSLSEEPGALNSEPEEYSKETACSPACGAQESVSLPRVQLQGHPTPEPPAGGDSASRPPVGSPPQDGAGSHPDPVRQLLQDELFRLVQLQQVNFMSLMQVVGASFANLPLTPGNPLLPPPCESAARPDGSARLPASPPQSAQDTRREGGVRSESASEPQDRRIGPADQQVPRREVEPCEETRNPKIQQLTVRSDWSKDPAEERCLIAPSQCLLRTVESHAPLQVTQGLRLLQLPRPQLHTPSPLPVREAWGPAPHRLNHSQQEPAVEPSRRCTDPTAPPQHLNLNRHAVQVQRPILEASLERGARTDPVYLPPVAHTAVGLPLLRCPPASQTRPVQLPRLPLNAPARPPVAVPVAGGPLPHLQLLHADPEPPSAGSQFAAPPARTPRLLPLEELMARAVAVAGRGADHKLQLLRTHGGRWNHTTSSSSSKRLRRREEKRREEKRREEKKREDKREQKAGVSFRPEDSIIPSPQSEDRGPTMDDGYVFPLGSFDSALTGRRLLDAAHSTSAELHAFAATHKRPPEIRDAGTNTDPAPPRGVTDKAVTAQLPVTPDPAHGRQGEVTPVVPPDVFLNLRFPATEPPDPLDQPQTSGHVDSNNQMTVVGRRFISVIDLEDGTLLQDPPPAPAPAHAMSDTPPTSAQLHLLAASVTNPAPTEPVADLCPYLSAAEQNGAVYERSLTLSSSAIVRSESGVGGDWLSAQVLTDSGSPEAALAQRSLPRVPLSRGHISTRLSELDSRLAALQSIADHMDREFANTRLLVNTIETLAPVVMPSEGADDHSSPLSVPKEAKSHQHAVRYAADLGAVEEEDLRHGAFFSSSPRGTNPPGLRGRYSLSPPAASAQGFARQGHAAPTEHRPWDGGQEPTEPLMEISAIGADDAMALTGLSDVADILGELVREGALSPSELRPAPSAAGLDSKREERTARSMVQEERKELRTWMSRRQKESVVEYHRQREEKRRQERRPFTPASSVRPSSRDLTISKKVKEERDKQVLLEHHSQRAREAYSLITDLLSTPHPLRTASACGTTATPHDTEPRSRSRSVEKSRRSPMSRRGRAWSAVPLGKTVVLHKRGVSHPHTTLSSRLGLHRPASALPGDRLSQVTRRGMLTDPRGRPRLKTAAQRPKTSLSRFPADQKPMGQLWVAEEKVEREEREVVSPWDVPLEIRKILGLESKDMAQNLVEADLDRLDTLSQSTGSLLSKLDWAAIDSIVAEEEEV